MTIYDTILWLKSQATGTRFPTVLFSADTDMATMGWWCLTSAARHEIVVTQLTGDEDRAGPELAGPMIEERLNAALRRNDLRATWLVRVEKQGPDATGLTFQEFRKTYRPPRLFYRDIFHPTGVAEEVSRVTKEEFERHGGRLISYEA